MTADYKRYMNFVDRTIAYFNPKAGMYRAMMRRTYEAGGYNRRTKNLQKARSNGPNSDVGASLVTLRNRSRYFVQNNGWANRAIGVITKKTIGDGIRPAPSLGTSFQIKKAKKLWKEWADSTDCDWDGKNTFYGLQKIVMKQISESGDCIIVRRRTGKKDKIPFKLQVLESDYIDHLRNFINEMGYARLGVQFDKTGKLIGYWIWSQHPNDDPVHWTATASEFISIDDIIHPFEILRPGQVRGVPMGIQCFIKLGDFSDYEDAQLVRQKVAAAFSAFIKGGEGADDELTDHIEPGIIQHLASDEEITFSSPPPAEGYDAYSKRILQGIAAGYEITYEQLTMDYSNVNFTSGRMAAIDASGRFRELQYNLMVPQFCVPVWRWFMDAVIMTGLMGTYVDCNCSDWTAPRVQMLDPVKETNARISQISAGLTTWSEVIREDGRDPEEFLDEYKRDIADLKAAGVNFTSVMMSPDNSNSNQDQNQNQNQ